jgi:hypothetical protein
MPNRQDVYDAIDSERDYQIKKWGDLDQSNTVGDFICYMQNYLDRARKENNPAKPTESIRLIRQVTSLGVACMERHGAPLNLSEPHMHPTTNK